MPMSPEARAKAAAARRKRLLITKVLLVIAGGLVIGMWAYLFLGK
ncbi:hypothetical protein [Tsuneonella aeria]|nr:hypothetical protein [Tsuneonella aeria]